LLVAVTVSVPVFEGALYRPDEVMVPNKAFQVTDVSETVPCTLAVSCSAPLVATEVEAGETVTEVTAGLVGAVVTVTTALADLVGSAALVAVTVSVPAFAGAV
jgi:hypothetical protein